MTHPAGSDSIAPAPSGIVALIGCAATGPVGVPESLPHHAAVVHRFGAASPLSVAARDTFAAGADGVVVIRVAPSPGDAPTDDDWLAALRALDTVADADLVVLVPERGDADLAPAVIAAAARICAERRALLLVDAPAAWSHDGPLQAGVMHAAIGAWGLSARERRSVVAVLPRLAGDDGMRAAAPAFAGVLVRTERTRGIGRPPTGREAPLADGMRLARPMPDHVVQQATLVGCTVLRNDPAGDGVHPTVARTLALPTDLNHRAVAHRRVLLHIERTLERALAAFVFEPNVPATWMRVRAGVQAFLHGLALRGAFAAATTQEGCFVKVDESTMSRDDIAAGRMHVIVGVALAKPAEFVLLRIVQQVVPPDA